MPPGVSRRLRLDIDDIHFIPHGFVKQRPELPRGGFGPFAALLHLLHGFRFPVEFSFTGRAFAFPRVELPVQVSLF